MNRPHRVWLLRVLISVTLTACAPQGSPPAPLEATTSPTPTRTEALPTAPSPTPLALFPEEALTGEPFPTEIFVPTPTASVQPLQLSIPTGVATDSQENRPPLYPIPWAISPYDHFYFSRPISASYPAEPLWDFRYGGVYFGPNEVHTGIDIPAPRGTPVLAAGPGTVVWAGIGLFSGSPYNLNDPYGNAVVIRHDFGYKGETLFTVYAHMDVINVLLGQWLDTGEQIGKVGTTGFTTGPHLHFEVRVGTDDFYSTRNPELWLVPAQGWGVLVGRVTNSRSLLATTFNVYVHNLETNRKWTVITYGAGGVNSDDYYRENVVLSDLPAGVYEINVKYAGFDNFAKLQILPGQVTYFSFKGSYGYNFALPMPPPPGGTDTPTP